MQANDQFINTLKEVLIATLSPDNKIRNEAEVYLSSIEVQSGFLIALLALIRNLSSSSPVAFSPIDNGIRQSASVVFKNSIKKYWMPIDTHMFKIHDSDRDLIKSNLIDLMCVSPPEVQRQLAEGVTVIAKHDFPSKWSSLLPQLVQKLGIDDTYILKAVMLTANSIMKRFRDVLKSDELFLDIITCINAFAQPLLDTYRKNSAYIATLSTANDKASLVNAMETQRLMTRIYFSLNWQDIPEFFEDNISVWMQEFIMYLSYTNPLLIDNSEESEEGPIEKLQVAIIENLNLYATKYEEFFTPFLGPFTTTVWKLLVDVGSAPKYDGLATSAMKFLTAISLKQSNTSLFTEQALHDIIQHIVLRNLTATEGDEELFQDNPMEYIRKDIEGSDQDTRRRSAMELVRGLLKFFNAQTCQICLKYIGEMLESHRTTGNWKSKDAALHLVLSISVRSSSIASGAGELNKSVDIFDIFNHHVLLELVDNSTNKQPIVKADCLKMLCFYRTHLPADFILNTLPHVIKYLSSNSVVIQTYAALCIEKFLSLKNTVVGSSGNTLLLTKAHISPFIQSLLVSLFSVLDNADLPANFYVMKCIVRLIGIIGNDVITLVPTILTSLTNALDRAYKNPLNANYNHNLFECIAVLIKSSCLPLNNGSVDHVSGMCDSYEAALFVPFQAILVRDMTEFTPYVIQIFSQLLLCRRNATSLSDAYKSLLGPIVSPMLWERKGYVPALTDLLCSYIVRGINDIIVGNHLLAILGVFQKLLSLKSTEVYAFKLLDVLLMHTPVECLGVYNKTIFELLLSKVMEVVNSKSPVPVKSKYVTMFIHSFCVFSATYGADALISVLNSIDTSVLTCIVRKAWYVRHADVSIVEKHQARNMIIGGCVLMSHPIMMQSMDMLQELLASIVLLIETENKNAVIINESDFNFFENEEEQEYDGGAYCKLAHLEQVQTSVPQGVGMTGSVYFAKTVEGLCNSQPGRLSAAIAQKLHESPAILNTFNASIAAAGVVLR